MLKHKDFEDYMWHIFSIENPTVLDDDYPDAFEDWSQDLSVDDWLEYGEKYAQIKLKEK